MSTIRVVNLQHTDATVPNIVLESDGTSVFASGITISGATTLTVSGTAEFASGTAAAPKLTFIDDNDTGIYSPAANNLGITTSGTAALTIDASQRVGIGTTSPTSNLTIDGDGTTRIQLITGSNVASSVQGIDFYDRYNAGSFTTFPGQNAAFVRCERNGTGADFSLTFGTAGATNASERMRIDSSGRLLVGTTSQSGTANQASIHSAGKNTLSIIDTTSYASGVGGAINLGGNYRSSGDAQAFVRISAVKENGTDSNYSYGMQFDTTANNESTFSTSAMRIDSSGRVGIGTTSPGSTIHAKGGSTSTSSTVSDFISNATARFVVNHANEYGAYIGYANGTTDAIGIQSTTNAGGVRALLLNPYGSNVGVGTTSPAADLHVAGDDIYVGSDAVTRIRNDGSLAIISSTYTTGAGYKPLAFLTSDTERMRIDTSGRLLVGTSSASTTAILQVQGRSDISTQYAYMALKRGSTPSSANDDLGYLTFEDSSSNQGVYIQASRDSGTWTSGSSHPSYLAFWTTANGASSPAERWRYTNNGETQIRNMSEVFPISDNACLLGKSGNRWSAVWAANGTIQTSDERAKTKILDAALGTDFVKSLRPVSYKWIEGGKKPTGEFDEDNNYIYESVPGQRTHWGFIAQEVKQVVDATGVDFGGWVLTDKDDPDSQQALRYDQFIAPLTKALQEAITKIETLEAKVAALEAQ